MGIDTHATWRALHGQDLQQNRHIPDLQLCNVAGPLWVAEQTST
jgi:hypothetical protein